MMLSIVLGDVNNPVHVAIANADCLAPQGLKINIAVFNYFLFRREVTTANRPIVIAMTVLVNYSEQICLVVFDWHVQRMAELFLQSKRKV